MPILAAFIQHISGIPRQSNLANNKQKLSTLEKGNKSVTIFKWHDRENPKDYPKTVRIKKVAGYTIDE